MQSDVKGKEVSKAMDVKGKEMSKSNGCQSKEMSKAMDVKAMRCQDNQMSKARLVTGNGMSKQRDVIRQEMSKAMDVRAKRCQSKGMSKAMDVKAKRCQRQWDVKSTEMSKARDVKGNGCQSKEMPKAMDVRAIRCQRQEMSNQRHVRAIRCQRQWMSEQSDVKGNGCQSKEMSKAMEVKAKICQSKGMSNSIRCQRHWMSKQSDVKAKRCQSNEMSRQELSKAMDVKAKRCQIKGMSKQSDVNCWNWKEVSHESFVFTSSTVGVFFKAWTLGIWRMSGTKASFSNLKQLEFERCLTRKLRFHIFNSQTLKEVSHESFVFQSLNRWNLKEVSREMRLWEIADARNRVFWRTKHVSDDVWGSLSGGRLRNTLGCTGVMAGSVAQWNCRLRRHFHNFNFQTLKEFSHENFFFTSSTVGNWRTSRTKASFSQLGTVGIWRRSRTKASFSKLEQLEFEGSLARNASLRDSGCTKSCILEDKTCLGWCVGKLVRRTVAEHSRLYRGHGRIGRAVELPVEASLSQFQLSNLEGILARKLLFHIFNCWKLKDIPHESWFRNSVSADLSGTDGSWVSFPTFLRVVLLSCAISLCRSHCNGRVKVVWRP